MVFCGDPMHEKVNGDWQHGISIRIPPGGDVYVEPCGFVPEEGLPAFWEALGVHEGDEQRLWPQWMEGNWVPVAPTFPILSELIQMRIDISDIKADDIPALLQEIEIGRANCSDARGLAVFDALRKCAMLALAQSKGIVLSPFG